MPYRFTVRVETRSRGKDHPFPCVRHEYDGIACKFIPEADLIDFYQNQHPKANHIEVIPGGFKNGK